MILEVINLKKYFSSRKMGKTTIIKAVDGVSFGVEKRKTIGLVGESGCGKSTVARTVIRLYKPNSGSILFDGVNFAELKSKDILPYRKDMQIVFQDPYASLPPRMTIEETLADALKVHHIGTDTERRERVAELMRVVGLDERYLKRYPHEFSGGQRQRICIARALILNPKLVILDEAVSALDVSVQSQVINLLQRCQVDYDLTYMFISHDLSLIEYLCEYVAVMYLGKIVEYGSRNDIFGESAHPYTKALLSAIPQIDPEKRTKRILLEGDIPSAANPPSGCVFHTRCRYAKECCKTECPGLVQLSETHSVNCHLYA